MNHFSLNLSRIRNLQLDAKALGTRIHEMRQITSGWETGGEFETTGPVDELRKRVRRGYSQGENFQDYTAVRRRESLLLNLYLCDLKDPAGAARIPPFDDQVAESILGSNPYAVRKHVRRLATQLYFTHYDQNRLPALNFLADFLKASWSSAQFDPALDHAAREWHENAGRIFDRKAPDKVAECWDGTWTVDQLADQLFIHKDGLFRERLWEAIVLRRLKTAPRGPINTELDRCVTDAKERLLHNGHRLGAEAVRVLIMRAKEEFGSRLPSEWGEQMVTFACDPRLTDAAERARWWGWATPTERDIAIQALSALTLRQFIELLRVSLGGTAAGEPFTKRAKMLLRILELGKVIDARLVVHESTYQKLPTKTRQTLRPLQTGGGPQHTSFVCLRCADNVWLIEGTHSFALRGFVGTTSFPVPSVWTANTGRYFHDGEFRISEHSCNMFQRHHTGDWLWDFKSQLQNHHIVWHGL